MNYFLIELHNRDGDKEYYDHVPIKSEMTNEEAIKKIKDFDYVEGEITDEECDSIEGYGVFYFPDGTEIDDRD